MPGELGAARTPGGLPRHGLSARDLSALVRGEEDEATVGRLLAAEYSRRLLMLRALDAMRPADPALSGELPADGFDTAWSLLNRAQRNAPETVGELLMYPQTGMWLSLLLRRLRGTATIEAPLWTMTGHLSAVAAVAGFRAGLEFTITVPSRGGRVALPTMGCATLPPPVPAPGHWGTALVTAAAGRLRVGTGARSVLVPAAPGHDGPGWTALRRIGVGPAGRRLDLALDDLDPYRAYSGPVEPQRLTAGTASDWRETLEEAWALLLREMPGATATMRRGLFSLTPLPARERFRPHSVSAEDAFGGLMASSPDDPVQMAVTLVHEFRHTKLGGLLHLAPLQAPSGGDNDGSGDGSDSTGAGEDLFYAPWRNDPRPLGGMLQGLYAFLGVTAFWRGHRTAAGDDEALAHFEFALWRAQVWSALHQVRRDPRLTPLGRSFVESLHAQCAPWLDDPVPAGPRELAGAVALDHRARWQAHHLRPPEHAVDEAARGWARGAHLPPAGLAAEPRLVPDQAARWLDTAATIARHLLTAPADEPLKTAATVTGATEGDLLLAAGDPAGARAAFAAHLALEPGPRRRVGGAGPVPGRRGRRAGRGGPAPPAPRAGPGGAVRAARG
ncbi:HEXXH motif domain-containing protein [Actinacidiphila rubida]|uniref:HEXXH motif domain-containing protein n=1 Tax=Actinacidiphila rubida TaxID=310780 RepID=UPI000849833E|nr:HEXXH motif domain-containing protein [Actinacidiphila rubida]